MDFRAGQKLTEASNRIEVLTAVVKSLSVAIERMEELIRTHESRLAQIENRRMTIGTRQRSTAAGD